MFLTKFEVSRYLYSVKRYEEGPKRWKLGHVTHATPICVSIFVRYAGRAHPVFVYQI